MSIADEIAKLAELRESGALSDEEFAEQKRRLLAAGPGAVAAAGGAATRSKKGTSKALVGCLIAAGVLVVGLPILGIVGAIAIPAYMKYMRRSKTAEATMNLRKLFDSSVSYFEREHVDASGRILRRQFPSSVTVTPGDRFCMDDSVQDKWIPKKAYWTNPTWQALNFALADPHYYSYEYVSEGVNDGAKFTARALGDLNCNGTFSTFERVGMVDGSLNVVGGGGVFTENELE